MGNLDEFKGFDLGSLDQINDHDLPSGGASPAFSTVSTTDFVSLTAYTDPNNVENNPVTSSGSDLVFDMNKTGSGTVRPETGATYRLNHHPDWDTAKSQAYYFKWTPAGAPGNTDRTVVTAGISDRDGDTTDGSVNYTVAGIQGGINANNWRAVNRVSDNGDYAGGGSSAEYASQSDRTIVAMHAPLGDVGDESNPAANMEGYIGVNEVLIWDSGSSSVVTTSPGEVASITTQVNDGIYVIVSMGMTTTGAGTQTQQGLLEWAVVDTLLPGVI